MTKRCQTVHQPLTITIHAVIVVAKGCASFNNATTQGEVNFVIPLPFFIPTDEYLVHMSNFQCIVWDTGAFLSEAIYP